MAHITDINFNSTKLSDLLELGRDYCCEQLGRFFQNKYSLPALVLNKFEIPAKLATRNEQDCFAICVMMNNHIADLKYFSDILPDWNNGLKTEKTLSEHTLNKITKLVDDQKFLSVMQSFKKINDEIVIGRCNGRTFIPL